MVRQQPDGKSNSNQMGRDSETNQLQSNKRAYKLPFDKMLLAAPIQEDGAAAKFQWHTIKKTMP